VNAETDSFEPQPDPHPTEWYLGHLLADIDRFATAVETGPVDAPVAACDGWDLARLGLHMGFIHRWARECTVTGAAPTDTTGFEVVDPSPDELADWLREGARDLADTLLQLDPESPTWHPFTVARVVRVWPRRQAIETALHRWDAELAIGLAPEIEPAFATDGIDESFEIVIPRLVARDGVSLPAGSVHVHCTDVDGEWIVWADADGYRVEREHRKGDAALRGPAEAILLRLWGRESTRAHELSAVGDESVLAAWSTLGGM
jgi:uncharacterized protein (TIGR03083 family)